MKTVSIAGLGWLGMPLAQQLTDIGIHVKGTKTTPDGVEAATMCGIESYLLNLTPEPECDADDLDAFLETDILVITLPASKTAGGGYQYVRAVQNLVDTAVARGGITGYLYRLNGGLRQSDRTADRKKPVAAGNGISESDSRY